MFHGPHDWEGLIEEIKVGVLVLGGLMLLAAIVGG